MIFATYKEKKAPVEFVLVQPNYNPYTEKFKVSMDEQCDRMISLADAAITDNTDFVVFPETALDSNFWYNNIDENGMVKYLRDSLLAKHEGLELITGMSMLQYYLTVAPPSSDAVKVGDNVYIQMFNSALLLKKEGLAIYKKNILVPFHERVPFLSVFPFLAKHKIKKDNFLLNNALGGEQNVLHSSRAKIGCYICYEGIYGRYCTNFVRNGVDILCTVANDGWWLKTNFMAGHLRTSQMRAVENRRSVVRSNNTGFTAGIDQCGRIVAQAPWWEPTALKVTLNKNKTKTLYTQWGDYIGFINVLSALFIICLTFYKMITGKGQASRLQKK